MNDEVGEFFNQNFICSFQKVGNFRIVNGQKQGGNVASYFCNPDGSVLHAIAGPVDAKTLLKEARWVKETRNRANLECHGDAYKTRVFWRQAHVERLKSDHQITLDVRQVPSTMNVDAFATTYIQKVGLGVNTAAVWGNHHGALDNKAKVHAILAVYPLVKIEHVYKVVFEKILNEKISTAPVDELGSGGGKR